jgi:hypothetical protein
MLQHFIDVLMGETHFHLVGTIEMAGFAAINRRLGFMRKDLDFLANVAVRAFQPGM